MNATTIIVTVCVAIGLEACCCKPSPQQKREERDRPAATATVSSASEAEPVEPKVKTYRVSAALSAQKLHEEYQSNEVRADSKYKGKRIAVAGKVKSIDKDFMGDIVLKLRGSDRYSSVSADVLDSEKGKAIELSKGETVVLICTGGTMVINMPTLRKCSIMVEPELVSVDE